VSVIANVCYNRVKGFLRKDTIRYIDNTRKEHIETHCDYVEVFLMGFFFVLNRFLSTEYCFQYGGGIKYLHRSPASCRRRHKGNPVLGGITGPPCSWGYKYGHLVLQVGLVSNLRQ
jgi:hypothetical protein